MSKSILPVSDRISDRTQFSHLPPEVIVLIASYLDRQSAAAFMLSDRKCAEIAREFVWRRVSGIDAIFHFFPFTSELSEYGGLDEERDEDEERNEDEDEEDENEEDEDEEGNLSQEEDVISTQLESREKYVCSMDISQKIVNHFGGRMEYVRALEVHESTKSASYHCLKALFPHTPLIPKLERLTISPRGSGIIDAEKEVDLILKLFVTSNLRELAVTDDGQDVESVSVDQAWNILKLLAKYDLRLSKLEFTLFINRAYLYHFRGREYFYPVFESLTAVTLHGTALPLLPLSFLSTLPYLTSITLDLLTVLVPNPPRFPLATAQPFPSLVCIRFVFSSSQAVAKVLSDVIAPRLQTLEIHIFPMGTISSLDISIMLESLASQKDTLRILEVSLGYHQGFVLSGHDIAALAALPNITHFKSSSFFTGDPTQVIGLVQSWPDLKSLVIPREKADIKSLGGLSHIQTDYYQTYVDEAIRLHQSNQPVYEQ